MTRTALALKSLGDSHDPCGELLQNGEELFEQGDLEGADKLFRMALERKPEHVDALNNLGVLAHQRGQRESALSFFTRALLADPQSSAAAENVLGVLSDVSQRDLSATGRYAFPYLLVRIGSGKWEEGDDQFLQQAAATLDHSQREKLLEGLLEHSNQSLRQPLLTLLSLMPGLTAEQIERLGKWIEENPPNRRQRDELEHLICVKGTDDDAVRQVAKRDGCYRDGFFAPGWERYPRRITAVPSNDDPFMKLVPKGAPSKQGGMRVLIVSDFNIAGQCTALMRALNKYTNHMARCIIVQDDYLSYDKDVLIRNLEGVSSSSAMAEACSLIPKADFFHFGRGIFDFPGIDWNKYVSPQNSVVQYYGSELRDNGPAVADFHAKTGLPAITAVDLTMYRLLPASYYHIQPYMLEMDELPQATWDTSGLIRLCHAPSSANYRKIKRTDLILEVMERLAREHKNVESVMIENMTNAECLAAKSRCHVHIVSLLTVFGLNAIESAAMGLVPICGVDNFSRLIYPESPVPNASAENLYSVVKDLVKDPQKAQDLGHACREWVRPLFDARNLVQKYWYLYDVIYNGLSVDYPEIFR
jgi:tetratricopeptide (TPR) repeat protein